MGIEAGSSTYYQAKRGIVQDGLVLHLDAGVKESYSGGNIWRDLSGNNENFTNANGASYTRDNGGAISYDGANDVTLSSTFYTGNYWQENGSWTIYSVHRIDIMNLTGGLFGNQKYTSETSPIGGFGLMLYGQYKLYWILMSYDKDGTKSQYSWNTGRYYTPGQLDNIAFVYDASSSSMKFYRNGSLSSSTTNANFTWTPRSSGADCRIATSVQGGWENKMQGNINTMIIYNKALSADEIAQNFNATRHRFGL
jgi:hypothetical protein